MTKLKKYLKNIYNGENMIKFNNVSFKYNKKSPNQTLDNINLQINSCDEFITILGHTGSGKSTLVQMMNALLLPDSGTIEIFDKTIKNNNKEKISDIRKKVGLVFQFPEYQLFEETVLKDVMFGPINFGLSKEEAELKAKETCKLLNIKEELYNKSPFNLSGGQMRRIAIAGILACDPDILILDEPTVGLDPKGRLEILELLKEIQSKTHKSIILVTHDMNVVATSSKRVLVMKEGKLIKDTTPKELFTNIEELKELNLDLPEVTKLAIKLKEDNLIVYTTLPLRKEELIEIIKKSKGDNQNE